jgi:ElaB/YqjD/DUF883 family membrane-anchored ribosome-binding protein
MVRPFRKEDMKDTIQEQLAEQTEQLQQLGERISETAKKVSSATNEYVQDNPWKTIAIAAGVGFLIGAMVMRGGGDEE